MTISNQIIEIFNYLGEKFGLAIDWSSENVMPYLTDLCSRVIKHEMYTSIVWIAIWVIGIIVGASIIFYVYKYVDEDVAFVFGIPGVMLLIIGIIAIGTQIFDLVECATIPETILIEKIRLITKTLK